MTADHPEGVTCPICDDAFAASQPSPSAVPEPPKVGGPTMMPHDDPRRAALPPSAPEDIESMRNDREHVTSRDCWCHPKVEYVPADRWWADGAMVNSGQAGDEHFVGDAASEDDANRIVEAHNAAVVGEPEPTVFLPPTDFSAVPVLDRMPEGLDPERSPFTAERDNALIAGDRYIDRVRIFNATEAQVRYALTALDEHEPGWREKVEPLDGR